MMKRFIQQIEYPNNTLSGFGEIISSFFPESLSGSLNETMMEVSPGKLMKLSMFLPLNEVIYNNSIVTPVEPIREHAMNDDMVQCITKVYKILLVHVVVLSFTLLLSANSLPE